MFHVEHDRFLEEILRYNRYMISGFVGLCVINAMFFITRSETKFFIIINLGINFESKKC